MQSRKLYLVTYRARSGKLDQLTYSASTAGQAMGYLLMAKPWADPQDIIVELYRDLAVRR